MIRLLGFFVRAILSLFIVVFGIVFVGPYLVKCVDKWTGKAEEFPSFAEHFQVIDRVRGLFEETEVSEVGFDDLLGLVNSESSDGSEGTIFGESRRLTPAEVKALGDVYLKVTGGGEAIDSDFIDSESTEGNRPPASGDMSSSEGL